jgi:hypothetical protein
VSAAFSSLISALDCEHALHKMAYAVKRANLEELWPELEAGISQLINNLNEGFPKKKWIDLYSYVPCRAHDLGELTRVATGMCTTTAPPRGR